MVTPDSSLGAALNTCSVRKSTVIAMSSSDIMLLGRLLRGWHMADPPPMSYIGKSYDGPDASLGVSGPPAGAAIIISIC